MPAKWAPTSPYRGRPAMANQDAAIMGMREMERQGMGGGGSPGRPPPAPEVRVNSVQPRTIDTELFQARYAHAPLEQDKLLSQIPLRRIGQPEDIADAVAFLASDWAAYITGQLILIDGGRTYQ
jgi:NAD(P)-dependent dehydrogenase (short-subunit alcohol dehydrogenase family)